MCLEMDPRGEHLNLTNTTLKWWLMGNRHTPCTEGGNGDHLHEAGDERPVERREEVCKWSLTLDLQGCVL